MSCGATLRRLILGACACVACGPGHDDPTPAPSPEGSCPRSDLVDVEIAAAAGEQTVPKVALAPDGRAWITWYSLENGNYNVRAQRLDRDGQRAFSAEGLLVSDKPSETWVMDSSLGVDQDGAAIVAVNDVRNGDFDPYAYKLTTAGDLAWGRDGVRLSRSSDGDLSPRLAVTDDGEAVIVWDRAVTDDLTSVVLQRVSRDGRLLWEDGLVVPGMRAASSRWGTIAPAGDGAVVLAWGESAAGLDDQHFILARKLDAHGQPLWSQDAVVVEGQTIPYYRGPSLETDGEGGVFVVWTSVAAEGRLQTAAQHVDKDGRLTMPLGGVPVSLSRSTIQVGPILAYVTGARELMIAWSERDLSQNTRGLYAQRLTLDGTRRWGDTGVELIARTPSGPDVAGMRATADGALLVYNEPTSPGALETRILGARLALVDAPSWSPIVLSGRVSRKGRPALGGTRDCGAWVVWEDGYGDAGDIRGSFLAAQ